MNIPPKKITLEEILDSEVKKVVPIIKKNPYQYVDGYLTKIVDILDSFNSVIDKAITLKDKTKETASESNLSKMKGLIKVKKDGGTSKTTQK